MSDGYIQTSWYRVLDKDDRLYCETSDFKEARKALEDAGEGSQMQKLWVKTLYQWRNYG